MADWCGAARSNYVRVKDMEGLVKALSPFLIKIEPRSGDVQLGEPEVCLLSESEYGGWESGWDEETETDVDFAPAELVCPYLEADQVLVLMESGAEKLRYITGHAEAFHSDGRHVAISLTDVYEKAAKEFGVEFDLITAVVY